MKLTGHIGAYNGHDVKLLHRNKYGIWTVDVYTNHGKWFCGFLSDDELLEDKSLHRFRREYNINNLI